MTTMTTMTSTTATAAPTIARPKLSVLTSTGTFVHRSYLHTLRTPDALIMAIALPTILMLMFTFVFGGAFDPTGGYVDYVVPGIILLCAGFGAASIAVDVSGDMATGIIDRFRTMPLRASTVITGHVIVTLIRNLVTTAVVIGVALAVGFRPSAGPLEWIALAFLVAGYILAITYLFAAVGLASSSPEAASGYGFILLFVPYLSSAFVPIATMPEWLQPIAKANPLTPIIETIRGLLMGTDLGSSPFWAVGWCLVIIVGAYLWGTWLFSRRASRR
jgi:ABC-2 type transport system permease protein